MCRKNVSVSSPLTANVAMPLCSQSAAATSSWVDSGFDAQSATSAPPAASVSIRFAVSVVTCRHAADPDARQRLLLLEPLTGSAPAPASRLPAHSMRSRPFGASASIPHVTSHVKLLRRSAAAGPPAACPRPCAVSFDTRTTSSWLTGSPNAFVTIAQAQHPHAERTGGKHLRHHRHAHHRGARLPDQPDLRRRLVGGTATSLRTRRARRRSRAPARAPARAPRGAGRRPGPSGRTPASRPGYAPSAQRRGPHHVQVIGEHDHGPAREARLDTSDRGRDDDGLGTELTREARQQRRHVHPVSLVEVHAARRTTPPGRRPRCPNANRPAWPGTPGGREARKVREREPRFLVERIAERGPEPRAEDEPDARHQVGLGADAPSRRAAGRSSPGPGRPWLTPSRSRERGLQALDDRHRRGVDAAADREVHAGEVPDHDERHQPRERRTCRAHEPPRPRRRRRARCRRTAGTAAASCGSSPS